MSSMMSSRRGIALWSLTAFAMLTPLAFAFLGALESLPIGVRTAVVGIGVVIIVVAAVLMHAHVRRLGVVRHALFGLTLLLGLGLFTSAGVPIRSADVARVQTSDGRSQEGVAPMDVSAWGRNAIGYGMHPAYGESVVTHALLASFPTHPRELELLISKPEEALLLPDGQPTASDGVTIDLRVFGADGRLATSESLTITQQRFVGERWVAKTVQWDSGVSAVGVAVSPGPPGSTPYWDSTLVAFEVSSPASVLQAIGRVAIVCFGFFVLALCIVLHFGKSVRLYRSEWIDVRPTWLAAGALLICALLLAYWIQSRTSYVFFWDFRNYWEKTETLHALMSQGKWREAMAAFTYSYTGNYSMLPAVGPSMFALLAGTSTRTVYALAVTALYAVPAYLMVVLLARRVLDGDEVVASPLSSASWVLASFVALVGLPTYFGTTQLLMPDIGGVVIVVAAILSASALLASLREPHVEPEGWQIPGGLLRASLSLGVLVALMFVFRRWYGLAAAGIGCVLAALVLFEVAQAGATRKVVLARAVAAAVLVAAAALPLLCWYLFAWSGELGKHDYSELYASYDFSLADDARQFLQRFGVIVPLLCVVGGVCLFRWGRDRRLLFLLVTSSFIACVLFLSIQSPGRHHFFLLMPLMGAMLAGLSIVIARRFGDLASLCLALVLVVGGLLATPPMRGITGISAFPGYDDWLPRRQPHAEGLAEISKWLASPDNAGRKFCLIASSATINQGVFDELWQILPDVPRRYGQRMIYLGQVDSVDGPPAPGIRSCGIFLVGVPFQGHLPPGQQTTLEIVQKDMVDGTGIGAAVDQEPRVFPMDEGIEIRGYRTNREITQEEYADLVRRFRKAKDSQAN